MTEKPETNQYYNPETNTINYDLFGIHDEPIAEDPEAPNLVSKTSKYTFIAEKIMNEVPGEWRLIGTFQGRTKASAEAYRIKTKVQYWPAGEWSLVARVVDGWVSKLYLRYDGPANEVVWNMGRKRGADLKNRKLQNQIADPTDPEEIAFAQALGDDDPDETA